jgi:hypothetical protein
VFFEPVACVRRLERVSEGKKMGRKGYGKMKERKGERKGKGEGVLG